jgi:hypothetical protein
MRDILQAIADHPWAFAALVLGIYIIMPEWRRK